MRLDTEHMVLLTKLESDHGGSVNNVSEDNPEFMKLRRFVKAAEPARKRKIYLGKRDEGILEMFNNGKTRKEMGHAWSMSPNQIGTVVKRLRRNGFIKSTVNKTKKYRENIDQIETLYKDGALYKDMVAEVGLSNVTIAKYINVLIDEGKVEPRLAREK